MLSLALPSDIQLACTVHAPGCYIVPRGDGRVIIGSTIEDCGFDKSLHHDVIADLRARATRLIPALSRATEVERWSGLRPGSHDDLPLLGEIPNSPGSFIAAGHFRMGILLAPATARVMAQLILGQPPEIDLSPFSPRRIPALQSDNSFTAAL
jgi:glycine oxidase